MGQYGELAARLSRCADTRNSSCASRRSHVKTAYSVQNLRTAGRRVAAKLRTSLVRAPAHTRAAILLDVSPASHLVASPSSTQKKPLRPQPTGRNGFASSIEQRVCLRHLHRRHPRRRPLTPSQRRRPTSSGSRARGRGHARARQPPRWSTSSERRQPCNPDARNSDAGTSRQTLSRRS